MLMACTETPRIAEHVVRPAKSSINTTTTTQDSKLSSQASFQSFSDKFLDYMSNLC